MGRYDALINKLYSDEADRKLARAFASHFGDMPGMDDRVSALLQEAARSAENVDGGAMTPQQAWDYLRDYAAAIGTPPQTLAGFDTWFDTTSAEFAAAETPIAEPAKPAPETDPAINPPNAGGAAAAAPAEQPAPPSVTAAPARSAPTPGANLPNVNDRISEIETKYMRAAPNTPEYKAYWLGEGGQQMQQEYRELVTARDTPQATAPPPMPAGGAAAPPTEPAPE